MDPALQHGLIYGLGLIVQAFFLIRYNLKENFLKFLAIFASSIGLALIIFIVVYHNKSGNINIADIYIFFIWFYIFFIISFIGVFFYKALYEINEKILLVWTMIFWYAYAVNFDPMSWLSIVFLVPTFVVLLTGFAPAHMDYFWKAFLYAWFLFILLFLAFIQSKANTADLLVNLNNIIKSSGMLISFSAGMIFLSIALHGAHLFAFLPITSKSKHWRTRLNEIREHAINLGAKYSDYQMAFKEALIIFLLIGGIFLGNYYFKIVSNDLIINLGIIGSFLYSERPIRRRA